MKIGQYALFEIQPEVIVTVEITAIEDGIAYGTGDDGEDYCTVVGNVDILP